jgi:hypothetical protein
VAAQHLVLGLLLLYTAGVVPAQICLWDYGDPCTRFPTLYFDVVVDTFFMVYIYIYIYLYIVIGVIK